MIVKDIIKCLSRWDGKERDDRERDDWEMTEEEMIERL